MAGSNTSRKQSTSSLLASYNVQKRSVGRPTKLTEDVLKKLEEAFSIGASDKEACFYAGISHQALYNYQEKHPEYVDRKEALKERPVLMARQTVMNNLATDVDVAKWYLERKRKGEFSAKVENDTTVHIVQPIVGGLAKMEIADVSTDDSNKTDS
jgi:hypothetical protein